MSKKYYIELLDRFFQGLTSEEENDILKDWIKNSESKEAFYEYYHQSWHLASDDMDESVQKEIFSNILDQIDAVPHPNMEKTENKSRIRRLALRYAAAAACISFLVGVGAYFFGKVQQIGNDSPITMSVENGQKADIVLADGTNVYINSDSKITYNNAYNKTNRTLVLEGEAFFEVAKNKDKPFIVRANGLRIEALGTSFNVKAHRNSKSVSVVLVEGSVKVGNEDEEDILKPNERLEYSLLSRTFEKTELHPNTDLLLWRSKELAFYGESLEEICNTLTRMYNWKFVFKSEAVKRYTYSGVIKNNSLDNVLNYISQTTAIRYEIIPSESTIIIYKK